MTWPEFLDIIFCSSCKKQNLELLDKWQECQGFTRTQAATITRLTKQNEQLKLLVPQVPPPIGYVAEKDNLWMTTTLGSIGARIIRHTLDPRFWIPSKADFAKILEWSQVDARLYQKHRYDCENYVLELIVELAKYFGLNNLAMVLDYMGGHAYGIVTYHDAAPDMLEVQSDRLFHWVEGDSKFYVLHESFVLI